MAEAGMPHVLIAPFPAQGHVHPMLKLAELMSDAGLYVTFLTTEHIYSRLVSSSSEFLKRLSARSTLRLRTIPDGLPEDNPRSFLEFLDVEESLRTLSRDGFRELLMPGHGWTRVSCVIADGYLPLPLEVGEEMNIPVMLFRTSSACSVWAYCSIPKLIESGQLPFSDNADMDELMLDVEGMESFLRRKDLPGLLRNAKSTSDRTVQFLMLASNNLTRATALILNTTEDLEASTLSYIRSICPITYTIGPLQLLHKSDAQPSIPSLWQEDRSCMTWLGNQPHKSVVYVSFGSITVMSQDALLEFWHGLVNSGHPFLWVIRPDMIQDSAVAEEVIKKTTEIGCLVAWAPQQEVLAHPAVGCFLTHSGWNSTLESIIAEVPMVCWPFFADQQVNSRFVSEVWKIGTDMKDTCDRRIVEKMVRKVMDGEEAEILHRNTSEMAKKVKLSVEREGSSYTNFNKLIQHIKLLSSTSANGL